MNTGRKIHNMLLPFYLLLLMFSLFSGCSEADNSSAKSTHMPVQTQAQQEAEKETKKSSGQNSEQSMEQYNDQDTKQDSDQDTGQDPSQDTGQDSGQDTGQDPSKDTGQDSSKDSGQDTGQDSSQDTAQDPGQDTGQATEEPFADVLNISNKKRANELLSDMTLEEKVGQMFFAVHIEGRASADIETYHIGGHILFSDDFRDKSREDIITNLAGYQEISKIPLLIGVDEEGGTVNRVSKHSSFRESPFKSPQELYEEGGFELIDTDTREKAVLLKSLGINVNLAPVCDISTNSKDYMYTRSFGKDAEQTADYVEVVVAQMKKSGIGSTLKHFPGYGSNADTHIDEVIDNRSYDIYQKQDFLPFIAGIEAGANIIMVSHNIVMSIDDEYPASLSRKVHSILRDELHFQGVIMTDSLSMNAIRNFAGDEDPAVLAIAAGNDMVISSDYDVQIPAVIKAVKDNNLTEETIDEAVIRILLLKLELGLFA